MAGPSRTCLTRSLPGRPTISGSTPCTRRSHTSAPPPVGRASRCASHARNWTKRALATRRHIEYERLASRPEPRAGVRCCHVRRSAGTFCARSASPAWSNVSAADSRAARRSASGCPAARSAAADSVRKLSKDVRRHHRVRCVLDDLPDDLQGFAVVPLAEQRAEAGRTRRVLGFLCSCWPSRPASPGQPRAAPRRTSPGRSQARDRLTHAAARKYTGPSCLKIFLALRSHEIASSTRPVRR